MITDTTTSQLSTGELKQIVIHLKDNLFTSNMKEDDLGSYAHLVLELSIRGQSKFVDSL
jgi:hypothetical protein